MTSDRHSLFVQTIGFLFRAQNSVADQFFARHLSESISSILAVHIRYGSAARDRQLISRDYVRTCKDVSSLIEQMLHVGSGDTVLLATAQERLLSYLRQLLIDVKNTAPDPIVLPVAPAQPRIEAPRLAPNITRPKNLHRNPTQVKILEFVKRVPECRPKDIIGEFSALSQRTVKRSIKELSESGLIVKKTTEDKAVYYSAVSP
jgi:hypothetical protein